MNPCPRWSSRLQILPAHTDASFCLQQPHSREESLFCEKLLRVTILYDLPAGYDENAVALHDGRETVGDGDDGPVLRSIEQCALDLDFGLGVES